MLPENLRNSGHISRLNTKYLIKYVPMLCAYNIVILNKCTRKKQNVPAIP